MIIAHIIFFRYLTKNLRAKENLHENVRTTSYSLLKSYLRLTKGIIVR